MATHICPHAPTRPHDPVPFMDSPVDIATMNEYEVDPVSYTHLDVYKRQAFKAVQTGGPSGGCIPASLLDLSVDFDTLVAAGSMMGSGGMIVMDDRSCMVDVARYFIDFLVEESCGKCTPCREGLKALQKLLHDLTEGKGSLGDVKLLDEMANELSKTALCGLGKTAANPVLSTLKLSLIHI